jgi:hypothetical protein
MSANAFGAALSTDQWLCLCAQQDQLLERGAVPQAEELFADKVAARDAAPSVLLTLEEFHENRVHRLGFAVVEARAVAADFGVDA